MVVAALVGIVTGTAAVIRVAAGASAVTARMKEKMANITELSEMHARLGKAVSARQTFGALTNCTPVSINSLVRECVPGAGTDDSRDNRRELAGGWILREREVTLTSVSFADMLALAAKAEAQRPPWQLVSCTLRAGDGKTGIGQAQMLFQALEKSR